MAGQVHRSYPRLVYLYDSLTPEVYDLTESKFNSVQLELKVAESRVFGKQFYWVVSSDDPYHEGDFSQGMNFWVINETVLSRQNARAA